VTTLLWIAVVVCWVAVGIAAVVLLLMRRGHRDPSWYVIGAFLGPIFVPIAAERAWRGSRRVQAPTRHRAPAPPAEPRTGTAVLVGVDGSAASDQAVRDAGRLVAAGAERVILAAVLDADAAEHDAEQARRRAARLLDERVGWLPAAVVDTDVAAGQPTRALLDLAEARDVDVLVVGRRGSGGSREVLGSVAGQLASRSTRPVLLASPPTDG
jgi:nucleotide-binding universal stress UspA family protein